VIDGPGICGMFGSLRLKRCEKMGLVRVPEKTWQYGRTLNVGLMAVATLEGSCLIAVVVVVAVYRTGGRGGGSGDVWMHCVEVGCFARRRGGLNRNAHLRGLKREDGLASDRIDMQAFASVENISPFRIPRRFRHGNGSRLGNRRRANTEHAATEDCGGVPTAKAG